MRTLQILPLNLYSQCDKCGTAIGATHTLSCIIDGLVISHNKIISDKLLYLTQRAFTSASVRIAPLIFQSCTRFEQEIRQVSDKDK